MLAAIYLRFAILSMSMLMLAPRNRYNIATFDSDVLRGPITSATLNFGLTDWGLLFLWANWLSFALGMAAALAVLHIDERYRTSSVTILFRAALDLWID